MMRAVVCGIFAAALIGAGLFLLAGSIIDAVKARR